MTDPYEAPAQDEKQKRDGAAMNAGAGSCPVTSDIPITPIPLSHD